MTVRRRIAGDEGTTLMELMVGMTIMSIFLAIFTTAIVSMFSITNKTQAVVNGSTQLNLAFERLDAQVRYANLIDVQLAAPNWSVAFQTDAPTSTTCRKLTVSLAVPSDVRNGIALSNLVERTWTIPVNADGSWPDAGSYSAIQSVLASGVTPVNAAVNPFTVSTPVLGALLVPPQQVDQVHQQLHLGLVAIGGNGQSLTKSFSEITFTALNSASPTTARPSGTSLSVCAQTEPTP
jgi:type II secretory pathway pseudopilin PulG